MPENRSESEQPSATGSVAANGLLALPRFILRQPDGLYVVPAALDSPTAFFSFVDRIFKSGLRFSGLDYACLHKILYETGHADIKAAQDLQRANKLSMQFLAIEIIPFPEDRRQCYKKVVVVDAGDAAQYLFEPLQVESQIDEPVYGEPDQNGQSPVIDHKSVTLTESVVLDRDEFVAAMWLQEVRFGLDMSVVEKYLAAQTPQRAIIARMRPPTDGEPARIEELVDNLHRNNAPKQISGGKVDLHRFENRFPQFEKDTRLVRKIPRVPGKSGRSLGGEELAAEIPQDVNMDFLAGLGTRVERTAQGEFVATNVRGFLRIDAHSGAFSISEKIVNLEGVSLRTTGNLTLSSDEYEEHGEVEEHTQIDGKNMMFMANVFGNIVSRGGRVEFKQNLTSGSVKNPGGIVIVEGHAAGALFEASGGEVTLSYAENCIIVGKKVTVEQAVHCTILTEELTVGTSEGSAMAAQRIQVDASTFRRTDGTMISMLIPDSTAFEKQLDDLKSEQAKIADAANALQDEITTITSQQDVKTYSMVGAKLRAKEITMTKEQAENWQRLTMRVAPQLRKLKNLYDEVGVTTVRHDAIAKKIDDAMLQYKNMSSNIHCHITEVLGETTVQMLRIHPEQPSLFTLPSRELAVRLRESDSLNQILFNSDRGSLEWSFGSDDDADDGADHSGDSDQTAR
jgi:hypothetical protein